MTNEAPGSDNQESRSCPQCGEQLTKVGAFLICPTHGQVPEPRPFTALRIFLSYGHDANEELVRRIKADLEQRGHDVWFDKTEIKAGDDWRRSITDGILRSQRVVSFLSKHSTRDPGVCRDEIAIAIGVKGGNIQTILVESEADVQPPVNIGHIQWLDMHDWKQQRAGGDAAWDGWYQAKLAEIVRVVESDESRRFAGEIETLNGYLKPIKSEARISQLLSKGFYGRQWLFDAVEKWRHETNLDSRLFWIMGAPGVGKSAFAAQLTHTRGDTVIAAQFCEWDKPDHRNAPRVVRSLAFQLATRLPDYRKLLLTLPEIGELDRKDEAELFDYLFANPLRSVINGGRQRYLIMIDALDEAGEAGSNPLVEMLARNAQRLPDWLGLVVTSRPEFDVTTPLQALNPFPLGAQSESNRADIRDYLRRELEPHLQNRPDADCLVEQILEKSEGVFLYVERFCDDVRRGHLSLDRPDQFPQGLGGIFCQYFQRLFPDKEKYNKAIEPALGAILAAREPLPVEILQKVFGWRETQLRTWLRLLASFFPITNEDRHEVIKAYHKSLADWLEDEVKAGPFFVSVNEGHRTLAASGWTDCRNGYGELHIYFLTHLPMHLVAAHRSDDFCALLSEPGYSSTVRDRADIVALLIFCDELLRQNLLAQEQKTILTSWLTSTPEDVFGRMAHERFLSDVGKRPSGSLAQQYGDRLRPWDDLDSTERARAWREVSEILRSLSRHGLGLRSVAPANPILIDFTIAEVESLAADEHERWCRERRAEGWIFAPVKDVHSRKTPHLVPWSHFPEATRNYDREVCRSWPARFARGGYEIYRRQ